MSHFLVGFVGVTVKVIITQIGEEKLTTSPLSDFLFSHYLRTFCVPSTVPAVKELTVWCWDRCAQNSETGWRWRPNKGDSSASGQASDVSHRGARKGFKVALIITYAEE